MSPAFKRGDMYLPSTNRTTNTNESGEKAAACINREDGVPSLNNMKLTLFQKRIYPQFSIATTRSRICLLERIFRQDAYISRLPVSIIQALVSTIG